MVYIFFSVCAICITAVFIAMMSLDNDRLGDEIFKLRRENEDLTIDLRNAKANNTERFDAAR